MLTDKAIRSAASRDKVYRLTDGRGLTLVVHPNGSRYWRLRYRIHGKEKTLVIGAYPAMSLAKARRAAEQARALVEAGTDPVQQRKAEKRQARIRVENSVEAIGREWFGQASPSWKPHHAEYVLRTLERDVFPIISENTMNRAIARMGFDATPHGFRALASTVANERTDFSADAIEKAPAHVERNKVRAAYHRAEYLDERRRLLTWWADYLDQQRAIGQGGNVVSLARKG